PETRSSRPPQPASENERAERHKEKRNNEQRPGGRTQFRLVADVVPVTLHHPRTDCLWLFPGSNAGADLMAHIASHRGVAVGYRLALAFETAQRLHQRLRLSFQTRIVELAISIRRRRQQILRGQRCGNGSDDRSQCYPDRNSQEEEAERRHNPLASCSFSSSTGTSLSRMSPMCW